MGHVRKSVYLMDVSAGFLQGYKVVGLLAATLTIRLHNAFTRPDHGGTEFVKVNEASGS